MNVGAPRPRSLAIRRFNPGGAGAFQSVGVQSIEAGFDGEAGSVILTPARSVTMLSLEQVEAIQTSVRAGTSWHGYQRYKRLQDRIEELEAEVRRLRLAAQRTAPDDGVPRD